MTSTKPNNTTANTTPDSNIVETIFETKEGYNECDDCQSVLSPAAYFVKLVETIEKYISWHKLKERRPDLFELPLDCNSTNKTKLYLEIANEIMEKNLDKKLGGNTLKKLATAKYPFNLPANFPLVSIRAYLEKQGISLAELYKILKPEDDNVAESLKLSPEEYNLIIDAETTDSHLKEVYGIDKSELNKAEKFIAQTNISYDELELLLDSYNKINKKPTDELSINSGNIDNIDQALGFLHRFIRLANKLNWSFEELCNVLLATDRNEIDTNSLKEISRIKTLQEKLKKPLSEVCKLYSNASISIEESKSEEDAKNAAESLFFLQGVKESDLKKICGIEEPSEPFKEENFNEFIARTGANRQEVEWLLSQSITQVQKAKKQEKISVKEQKFLHNFTQLVGQLKLLFGKLNMLVKELPSEFKLKDLVTNVDNSNILQNIWNISKEELTSLINYNDKVSSKTGKSLILEMHKQILLARLMNISIVELIQISLQLDINELTINNVEHIIELNDWLNDNSITIEQLNTLINSSALSHQYMKEIKEIEEEIEKKKESEIKKRLDSLVNHAELTGEWKIQIEKILEESEIKKLKNREKLEALTNDSTLAKECKTKIKGILEELKSKEKLDSLINDSTLSEEHKIKEITEKTGNKKLTSKERLDALINDSTISKKCKTRINEVIEERENLHNEIRKHFNVSSDVLAAAHQFTEKKPKDLQLLRLESLDKSIVHDVSIIDNKVVFLGKSEVHSKNSVLSTLPDLHKKAAVATIGTKTIVFGGERSGNEYSKKINIYDAESRKWEENQPYASEARANASVAIVDTKAIFFGGNKGKECSSNVDIYNNNNGDWTTYKASEARENASVAVVDGKAIFFGGKRGEIRSNKIDIYDTKTDKWLVVNDTASEARDSTSVAVVGEQVVFFGGLKDNQQYSKYIDIYDSITNSWKATDKISEIHKNIAVTVIGTKAIFFTRDEKNNQIYVYDSTSYSKDEDIAKSWVKRTAKETKMKDGLLTNSTKYSEEIDIYDNVAKIWKKVDVYKPSECTSIKIDGKGSKVFLNYKDSSHKEEYSIGLSITYDATIEELLNNAIVFTMLKMDAEDINNITDHADTYKLEAIWTKEQIKTLANYKALQDEFSGNELTLSQYTEWLRNSYDESKVTEKIAQLTNWDKKILDIIKNIKDKTKLVSLTNWDENVLNLVEEIKAFEQCFNRSNHPIDSILTIKSFIDVIERSTIDGKVLLKLGALHDLKADDAGWKIYKDTEQEVKSSLSYVEGVKEQLEDQKRNVLANYMIYGRDSSGNKMYADIKNMRGLYAFLLIDVEMSDCSKISLLKAGLNSLQLYIHRCILGLEKGVTISSELTEEKWDLLDNYREWEATKKVALYPENYLNSTLRKSATAEYKALQNTLMQGNITDEEAANAYIKYFEDFAQLVNLKVVDLYFAGEKKELYILARTIAEPYTYYYRISNFSDGMESPLGWLPWQKIEVQIPVSIARIVHAFGRVFVFWLQKTEKEKQVEDVLINDSTLLVNYIFKKVDGSWSAQQKLPHDIKIGEKYESNIREYFSSRNWAKAQQEICEGWQAKDKETKVNYDKDGTWTTDIPVEEAIEYFKSKVKKWNGDIKSKVKESKDINEKFDGKLQVTIENSEVLILSCEYGFQNSKFILQEDLTSKRSYTRYFNSMNDVTEAEKSITAFYNKKKEDEKEAVTKQLEEIQKKIDKEEKSVSNEQSKLVNLKNEKGSKERSKDKLESEVRSIKQGIEKRNELCKDIENLKVKLNNLFLHRSGDPHEKVTERDSLREVIDNLKQELTQYKQNVENTNVKLLQKLVAMETKVITLIDNIAKLATEETVDNDLQRKINDIIKQLDSLQLQEVKLDPLEEPAEKRKLQTAADNLKQKLIQLKQSTESKKVELLKQATELETEVKDFESKMNSLQKPEKTIEELKKEKDSLESTVSDSNKDIQKLDDKIKEHEKKKSDLDEKISKLKKNKGEIEAGNHELAVQKRNKKLDDKMEEEIKLVKELSIQKNNDTVDQSKYKDEKVYQLINVSYKNAYIKGSGAILDPKVEKQELNFEGFYGVYLWEIFFHIPTLIAYLFNQEQKFAEARKWYQYIFNPTKKGCNAWQFVPFKTKCENKDTNNSEKCDSGELVDSLDPYKEADKKKISYEKYIIMSYVDNLIDWGDMLFSQNSWEGINQATMLYIRAWDLLGEKPKKKGKRKSEPQNVCQISNSNIKALCTAETAAPSTTNQNTSSSSNSATTEYCTYFCTPENKDFIGLWDRIEDRLYKIRHCLDIKGKRLELPLFQPPIDPRQLISVTASGSTIMLPKIAQVPHYRFRYMITYAKSIADTVTQIGSELLSVLEKKDAEALTLLYNKQEGIMANLMTIIKEKAIEALKEEAKALNASLSSAKDRKSHYEKLINEGLSATEIAAMATAVSSTAFLALANPAALIAGALSLIPNIFGLACGGSKIEGVAKATTDSMILTSNTLSNISQNISTYASYDRRAQDWDLQKIMATHDTEQISYQIEANKINQANAVQDLRAHRESIEQIKEKESFFRSKFTNQELYSWMKGELKSLYIKTYRLALEIAKQAERAYQYEIDNDKAFIQPGHWNSLKEGLLSGQKLKFELEQLDKEYHDTNERRLEITKVISLNQLDPIALYELKTQGKCKFSLTEKLFDLDFPGHYARKIKDIKITIPAVVGPYENIHASLQQTSNQIVLKSEGAIKAIKYLVNPSEGEQPETDLLRVNWKPNQEIAISKADQDSGLFELSFGDERYLPFEGTGAVSTWELSLPQATNRFDISTISDVIINLDYTALNGGGVLSRQVKNLDQIKYYQGMLVVNLSSLYPEEWNKFKQQAKGNYSELKFKLSPAIFPVHVKNPSVDLVGKNNIYVIPITPDMSKTTIKVNNYSWESSSKKIVNPSLTIGSDWSIKINDADTNKIEEITIMVPYKATISW